MIEVEWARYQAEAVLPGTKVPSTHRPPYRLPPTAPRSAPAVPLAIAVPYHPPYNPPYYNLAVAPPPPASLAASHHTSWPAVASASFRMVPQAVDARGNSLPRPQDKLCALPRSELQALAKAHGLRATQKTDDLVREVRARLDLAAAAAAATAAAVAAAAPTPPAAPTPSVAPDPSAENSGLDLLMAVALG